MRSKLKLSIVVIVALLLIIVELQAISTVSADLIYRKDRLTREFGIYTDSGLRIGTIRRNAFLNRWDLRDNSGSHVGYWKKNDLLRQWEFKPTKRR